MTPSGPGRRRDAKQLLQAAIEGDRLSLARIVSLIERGDEGAREIGRITFPRGGNAYTVGVTGAPGSGKSTLVDRLVSEIRQGGDQVAVLAIDPSSPLSGGAILGDRVRMQEHALDDGVFIRSMATRGHLGGLALAVPETMRALDAAGMAVVLVETVGVGQVEVEVAAATDTTVVVLNPGWGDAVQANKAGLLEVADVFAINKADRPGAKETRRELDTMLDMSHLDWRPPIVETVATTGEGTGELWAAVELHRGHLGEDGRLDRRRGDRLVAELRIVVASHLHEEAERLFASRDFEDLRRGVVSRQIDPYEAAARALGRIGGARGERGRA